MTETVALMDAERAMCGYQRGQSWQPLMEILRDVEAVDNSLPRHPCWQDVLDAIDSARSLDEAKAEKSVLRARLRRAGPEIVTLESLTKMIPDQDGLKVLCGGLATLFKMVGLRLEIREMILRAFETIPETFQSALEATERFPDDPDLPHALGKLFHTLVEKVPVLIAILLRGHPHKHRLKRWWRQLPAREAEDARNCLDEVARAAERVQRCSTAALERTVGEMRVEQHAILANTGVLNAHIKAVQSDVGGIKAAIIGGVAEVKEDQKVILNEVKDEIMRGIHDRLDHVWQRGPQHLGLHAAEQQPALPWLPISTVTTSQLLVTGGPNPILPMGYLYQPLTPPATPACVSVDDVLAALDVPEGATQEALNLVACGSHGAEADTSHWSSQLIGIPRFRQWLGAPGCVSDLVLFECHCGRKATNKVSPVSAICASLAGVLMGPPDGGSSQVQPAAILLYHFCGHHVGMHDPLRGPTGLIRSLVHQLVAQSFGAESALTGSQVPLDFVDDELFASLKDHDIASLCRLFCETLVRLDPSRPVFCIVDGISEIETDLYGSGDGVCIIAHALLDMAHQDRGGPALRVFLASSERSTALAESIIPFDRQVSLMWPDSVGRGYFPDIFECDVEELLMAGETQSNSDDVDSQLIDT